MPFKNNSTKSKTKDIYILQLPDFLVSIIPERQINRRKHQTNNILQSIPLRDGYFANKANYNNK